MRFWAVRRSTWTMPTESNLSGRSTLRLKEVWHTALRRVWGWALTPWPKEILPNGVTVWLDGVLLGQATYGFARPDIQLLFPGYKNTDTALGYFELDTTAYENGVHNIAWRVEDDARSVDGIGSRFFRIEN